MHTNHRRKARRHHNPKHEGRGFHWHPQTSLVWWRKSFWKKTRAQTNELMYRERYDDLPARYVRSILWDIM